MVTVGWPSISLPAVQDDIAAGRGEFESTLPAAISLIAHLSYGNDYQRERDLSQPTLVVESHEGFSLA